MHIVLEVEVFKKHVEGKDSSYGMLKLWEQEVETFP